MKVLALKLGLFHHCSRIKGKTGKNGHRALQSCAWANRSPGGTHSQSTPPLRESASSWEGSVSTLCQQRVRFGTCIILSAPLDHELRQALCYPLTHDPLEVKCFVLGPKAVATGGQAFIREPSTHPSCDPHTLQDLCLVLKVSICNLG